MTCKINNKIKKINSAILNMINLNLSITIKRHLNMILIVNHQNKSASNLLKLNNFYYVINFMSKKLNTL